MNQVKSRLQALGLLDRAFANASDAELQTAIDELSDEHREAVDELVGGTADPDTVREAIGKGRLDGTMESAALVLTDACLADCIEQLGEHADHPTSEQLRAVLPGLCESHGKAITQLMLASTVAGEAPASAIIRDVLKNDDDMKLPKAEPKPISTDRAGSRRRSGRTRRPQGQAQRGEAAQAGRSSRPTRAGTGRPPPLTGDAPRVLSRRRATLNSWSRSHALASSPPAKPVR